MSTFDTLDSLNIDISLSANLGMDTLILKIVICITSFNILHTNTYTHTIMYVICSTCSTTAHSVLL